MLGSTGQTIFPAEGEEEEAAGDRAEGKGYRQCLLTVSF